MGACPRFLPRATPCLTNDAIVWQVVQHLQSQYIRVSLHQYFWVQSVFLGSMSTEGCDAHHSDSQSTLPVLADTTVLNNAIDNAAAFMRKHHKGKHRFVCQVVSTSSPICTCESWTNVSGFNENRMKTLLGIQACCVQTLYYKVRQF